MPGQYDYLYKYLEDEPADTAPTDTAGYINKFRQDNGLTQPPQGQLTEDQNAQMDSLEAGSAGVKRDVTAIGTIKDAAVGAANGVFLAGANALDNAGIGQNKPNFQQVAAGDVGNGGIPDDQLHAQTISGGLAEGISQFYTGYAGYGRLLKVVGTGSKLFNAGKIAVQSALSSATVFDPFDDRLSNLVEEHTSLGNPITAFMSAKPGDTRAEGMLKNALEDVGLGLAGSGLAKVGGKVFKLLKARKEAQKILESKGAEAAAKHIDDAVESLEQGVEQAAPEVVTVKVNDILSEEAKSKLIADIASPQPDAILSAKDFNYSKMDSPEGAKQVMDEMSKAIAPQMDLAKGGKQTLRDIEEVADALGENPDSLMGQLRVEAAGSSERAARFVAGKRMLQSMAREVSDLAGKVHLGNEAVKPELDAMLNRMANLQTDLKAIQTSSARTTSAGRIRTLDSFSPQEIRALIAADGDMKAVNTLVRQKSLANRVGGAAAEYWINAILSNPVTHSKNILSNAFNSVFKPGKQMVGGLMTLDTKQAKEGLQTLVGLMSNARDSWQLAKKSFLIEDSILDSTGKMEAREFSTGNGWLGKTIRLSSRFLTAEDEFFKQINYRANLKAKLTGEGIDNGLKGDELLDFVGKEFDKRFEERIVKGEKIKGGGLDADSLNYAKAVTFTDDLDPNSFVSKINRAANQHPWFKLVVPFIRTPWNILKNTAELTPIIGQANASFINDVKAGGARRADALGRMTMGAGLYSLAYMGAQNGMITGSGPSDPEQRAALKATGWQPDSIWCGDTLGYISYAGIEPLATVFSLVANYHETAAYMTEKQRENVAMTMVASLSKSLVNKTYLRGIADVVDALEDPERYGQRILESRTSSLVPFSGLMRNIRDQADDSKRATDGVLDAVKNTIPGWSKSLPPQRNLFGEVLNTRQALGPDLFSPFTSSRNLGDAVADELADMAKKEGGFSMPRKKIGNVDLSPQQYDQLLKNIGETGLKDHLKDLVKSPEFKEYKDALGIYHSKKYEDIERLIGAHVEIARNKLIDSDKDLQALVVGDKQNKAAASANAPEAINPLSNLAETLKQNK